MSTSRDHILAAPLFTNGLRIAQLVVAIVILGLSAYGVTFFAFDGDDLNLFTAIATIIITVYIILATFIWPIIYNYWAILGLDIFAIVFWLTSFALLASEVAGLSFYSSASDSCYYYDGVCYRKQRRALGKRATTDIKTYRNSLAAAAGLGGLEFLLFIISLVITSIFLHRHRKAGGHCMPVPSAATTNVEMEPKMNAGVEHAPVAAQEHYAVAQPELVA